MATRIPFSTWAEEPLEAVLTAFELLDEQAEATKQATRG